MAAKVITEKSRKSQTSPLKEAIQEMLEFYKIKNRFDEKQVVAFWSKLMGAPIANRTSKIFIKDKTLYVELTSAPLKNELNMSKTKILQLIEKEYGQGIINGVVIL
jgi:predicted nucleic acid-binding Zn ribbon protein